MPIDKTSENVFLNVYKLKSIVKKMSVQLVHLKRDFALTIYNIIPMGCIVRTYNVS